MATSRVHGTLCAGSPWRRSMRDVVLHIIVVEMCVHFASSPSPSPRSWGPKMRRPGVSDGSRKSGITPSLISSCVPSDGGIGGRCAHANGRPYITR